MYTYGSRIKGDSPGSIFCLIHWYPDGRCAPGSEIAYHNLEVNASNSKWEAISDTVQSPVGATWAYAECAAYAGGSGQVDMVFLKAGSGTGF